MNLEAKAPRETTAFQGPEEHLGPQEKLEETAPEVIQVMLDQEENLDHLDQREILEDLASTTLEPEDQRVREERRATADLVAAEETVVKRATRARKELPGSLVSQDFRVNLAKEDQEERLDVREILDLREILA